jgi:toxin ParE1/3/4
MIYPVRLTAAARRDLEEIHNWISEHDSLESADYVLDCLNDAAHSISTFPHRGTRPKELSIGLKREYRQVFFKPYRVIYEVINDQAVIHVIADGRRNLQFLLLRRLTEG